MSRWGELAMLRAVRSCQLRASSPLTHGDGAWRKFGSMQPPGEPLFRGPKPAATGGGVMLHA
jgi:hypothetical protein